MAYFRAFSRVDWSPSALAELRSAARGLKAVLPCDRARKPWFLLHFKALEELVPPLNYLFCPSQQTVIARWKDDFRFSPAILYSIQTDYPAFIFRYRLQGSGLRYRYDRVALSVGGSIVVREP